MAKPTKKKTAPKKTEQAAPVKEEAPTVVADAGQDTGRSRVVMPGNSFVTDDLGQAYPEFHEVPASVDVSGREGMFFPKESLARAVKDRAVKAGVPESQVVIRNNPYLRG